MTSFEFRRQQSRVWWSSFHGDELVSSIGSPIPRNTTAPAPIAAPATPVSQALEPAATPGQGQVVAPEAGVPEDGNHQDDGVLGSPQEQGSRNASSSPSTSHKSQDSGFSDSDGSHRANASPLSSSPEVTDGVQLPGTPSPTHTRLQLCLSGACTSTPRDATPRLAAGPREREWEGPASFGGHATPGELRRRFSQDDSCIQSRPLPAIPVQYRRQHSADEPSRRDAPGQPRRHRASRVQLSRTAVSPASLDTSLEEDSQSSPLNQTFPLSGPPESGHRVPRCFIKNRAAARRTQPPRYGRTPTTSPSTDTESTVSSPQQTTVLHVRRTTPDGEATVLTVCERDDVEDADAQRHLFDVTVGPGIPAHTSTPKTVLVPASPMVSVVHHVPATTPTRRPAGVGVAARRLHSRATARPVNLLTNFNNDEVRAYVEFEAPVVESNGAVAAWLGGLRLSCELEPSVTLQSKALIGADPKGLRQLSGVQLASPQGLGILQRRAHLLSSEYTKLCSRVQRGSLDQVGTMTQTFVGHVHDFLDDHVQAVPKDRVSRLHAACERLSVDAAKQLPEPADMAASLAAVRAALTNTVDAILETQVQELVNVLEGPASPLSLRTAVSALCALGRQGAALSDLVVRCGGVRALLQVVLDARTSATRRAALRALSAVCSTAKAVRSLEQAGGVEVVAELLSEDKRPEEERAEAAAVLAQITAPWVPDHGRVEGLALHLTSVVEALTRLVREASSVEILLLASAALSHLSYVEPSAVWPLLTAGSAGAVLQAVRALGARCSVFLQEQAATLVANMSAVPEARAELAAEMAVVALLCFLQLRPSPLENGAKIAAAERVQHKAAIALSRLASDPEVAHQVVSLEGVPRLVRLCRDEKERNHSDGVLVACLAALRKIAANCGSVVLSARDHQELLEPKLLDSFMLFSTRQESYV